MARKKYSLGGLLDDTEDPTTPVYKTQAEVDAANAFAKNFARRHRPNGVVSPDDVYVARRPGDPVVPYIDGATGKPFVDNVKSTKKAFRVPDYIGLDDIQGDSTTGYYYEDKNSMTVPVDNSIFQTEPKFRPKPQVNQDVAKFATGGDVGEGNTGSSKETNWSNIANVAGPAMNGIFNLIDALTNTPSYSTQPIVNASTARTMSSPYKFGLGGDVNGDGGGLLEQLQSAADEQGISLEELISQLQSGNSDEAQSPEEEDSETDDNGDEEEAEESFAYGGMYSKNRNRNNVNTPSQGRNNIEVEGGEVMQTPNGSVRQINGPKHESGGVDKTVPDGTKIYSDRVKIDGKTMAERKIGRERSLKRLQKLLVKSPNDALLKNTLNRTLETHQGEEQKDMAIQNALNEAHNTGNKKAYGDPNVGGPTPRKYNINTGLLNLIGVDEQEDPASVNLERPIDIKPRQNAAPAYRSNPLVEDPTKDAGYTPGDLVGMAGEAFGAIAPLFNTSAAARATKPNINRFRGYGHQALEDNNKEQNILSGLLGGELSDIGTNANTAMANNRNSAQSVNTLRALDATTTMGKNKAESGARANYAKELMGTLGERQAINLKTDYVERQGEAQRDTADKYDLDNYFTNRGADLAGLTQGAMGIGRAMNIHKSNNVNTKLISQLSKYGLTFDKDGNLITGRS